MKPLFFTLALLLTLHTSFSQEELKKPLPAEILLKKNNQYAFSISPDGKYFAEVQENNIENDIIIIDIDAYKLHHRIPIGKSKINGLHWLTSKRLLYESSGAIYAIDIDGTNATQIVKTLADNYKFSWRTLGRGLRFNSLISTLPGNKDEILIETTDTDLYSSIKRVNIFTGNKITVFSGKSSKINKWILNSNGEAKLAIRYDKGNVNYLTENEKGKWFPFYVNIDNQEIPLKISAESFLDQNINFEGFGYNPNTIFLSSNIGSDKRKLLEYNIVDRKVSNVLLENINCDISDPHGAESLLIFDSKNSKLAGIRYEGITPRFKWLSKDFMALHDSINKKHPAFVNEIIDFDTKNKRFLIYQWSDVSKGNIGVYDRESGAYFVMFHFNEELNKYKLSKTRSITIDTRDGHKIPCYLNLPTNYSKENKTPLIVLPHGGPWARDYWEFNNDAQYFTARGYAVLRVNFRGSTGFGKDHVIAGIKNIDKMMIDDIADATTKVIEKYNMDKENVHIYGYSYGGYATYMSLIKYPKLYASGVAISAPSDIKKWMKKQKKDRNHFSYEFWNTALGDKKSKYLSQISPINLVKELNNPILIFHGKRDGIISVEQSKEMDKELKKYNKKSKLEILNSEGHTIKDSNTMGYVLDKIFTFFGNN